jgi:dihydroxy-acid dehydratase
VSEAQEGGPIALVRDGDVFAIDVKKRAIDLEVPAAELERRCRAWSAPRLETTRGVLAKYVRVVRSASQGCVTDE